MYVVLLVLGNNPRLVSPCIDVPLASVQIERTDSLELIPSVRDVERQLASTYFTLAYF